MPELSSLRTLGCLIGSLVLVSVGCASSATTDAKPVSTSTTAVATQRVEPRKDWGDVFTQANASGTFAMREVGSGVTMVWNIERADEPRRPASTFKILNSLIVLETEIVADTDTVVPWDGVVREVSAWNQDHTMRTGIEVSAVWMYQELARQVGEQRMQQWVTRADYGNTDIGGGVDQFWLTGDLRISPLQQLDFLEALATRDLPFRAGVQDAVAEILVREHGDSWTWSHKTGTALIDDPELGWLVGASEYDGRTFVFAMNLDLEPATDVDSQLDPQVRQSIARQILESEGALPT